ncbi:MAG: phosphate butyryltransferase [Muribaculaceae bacterium]|nr:phosphate butyryltransferase [Muribaculaceae bacterium]MBQ3961709.1 phosphate butyryltransferase [Muribaculaceae bacterium]MBQ5466171.1 phosphate butyryltransferase [Muribaculaceae bacterium]
MKTIKSFQDIISHLQSVEEKKTVAVVWAEDDVTRSAVLKGLEAGIITVTFVGCRQEIEADERFAQYKSQFTIIDAADRDDAAAKAVTEVREDRANVLMKGLLNTDNLLRAVLNKETGILPKGNVLTHVTVAEIPELQRLLLFTDAAVLPNPTVEQRIEQVKYVTKIAHALHIDEPKISLIHCSEKVDERHFPCTADYVQIKEKAAQGEFGKCVVDGPLDLKTSLCYESMHHKGINSPINGEADALLFPEIESGNVFYKTITLLCKAQTAGLLQGAKVPVVLPSRGDTIESKFYSLAVASTI